MTVRLLLINSVYNVKKQLLLSLIPSTLVETYLHTVDVNKFKIRIVSYVP
jgi:hypothetical protein